MNLSDADSITKFKSILAYGMTTLSLVLNPVLGNASGCTVDNTGSAADIDACYHLSVAVGSCATDATIAAY